MIVRSCLNYTGINKNKLLTTFASLCLAVLSIFLTFFSWFSGLNQEKKVKKMLKSAQNRQAI